MPNARGKVTVGAEVDEELRDRLDKRATAERRSRSEVMVRAFRFYLEHAEVIPADAIPAPKKAKGK